MRPVPLTPAPPMDDAGKLRWIIDKITALCNASQIDKPVDIATEMAGTYQPRDEDLTTIGSLSKADGNFIVGDGSAWTVESGAAARASLGLTIGTHVQEYDELLGEISALSVDPGADSGLFFDDSAGNITYWTPTSGLEFNATNLRMTSNQRTSAIIWTIDGGGAAITTGQKGYIEIPFACTITAARLLADQSGSIVVDVKKDTYANFPPSGSGDSICASAKPTITAATKSSDTTLTGWTTSVAVGDILGFDVDSASTITRCTIILTVTKT